MLSSCRTWTLQNFNPVDLLFAQIFHILLFQIILCLQCDVTSHLIFYIKILNNSATKNTITIEETPFVISFKALPNKLMKNFVSYTLYLSSHDLWVRENPPGYTGYYDARGLYTPTLYWLHTPGSHISAFLKTFLFFFVFIRSTSDGLLSSSNCVLEETEKIGKRLSYKLKLSKTLTRVSQICIINYAETMVSYALHTFFFYLRAFRNRPSQIHNVTSTSSEVGWMAWALSLHNTIKKLVPCVAGARRGD